MRWQTIEYLLFEGFNGKKTGTIIIEVMDDTKIVFRRRNEKWKQFKLIPPRFLIV
jgi:hypothetical protein